MAIVVVDCDADRRPALVECVTQADGGVAPRATEVVPTIIEPGVLLICHVGDRQHEKENRILGQKLRDAAAHSHCTIAGFTGGSISPDFLRQMPPQGHVFVINDRASWKRLDATFETDIRRLVAAWRRHDGKLVGERLAQAWIGYDPGLEAILDILVALSKGEVPADGVEDVLEDFRRFGISDPGGLLRACVTAPGEAEKRPLLIQLRDHLFRSYSRPGVPG